MTSINQDSLSQKRVEWFENMEHVIVNFSTDLDTLETELRHRQEQRDVMPQSEMGLLLLYLRGWRETGERIIELAAKCERLTDYIFRTANDDVGSGFYARRAEHYQRQADELRELAARNA